MKTKSLAKIGKHIVLLLFSALSVLPFLWVVICSTNTSVDMLKGKMTFGSNLVNNFKTLLDSSYFVPAFFNSIKYTLITTVLCVIVSSAAGYAFVVYRSKVKDIVLKVVLTSMMIPGAATLIPLFRLFSRMNLLNTTAAFALPSIASAFMIFLFRQATLNFPNEIIQAARIDGVSEIGIYFRIFIPNMKPAFSTGITMTFMGMWNSFLWPLVVLTDSKKTTMPVFLSLITDSGNVIDYGAVMLAVTITTIPTLIVFFTLQKSYVQGLTGAVKG